MKKCISRALMIALLWTAWSTAAVADGDTRDYYKAHNSDARPTLPKKLRYDYPAFARKITADCTTDYDKAAAIYKWICDNIAYDVDRKVYTADRCLDTHTGMCQAYCELYYLLATGVGLDVEVVKGIAKDSQGELSPNGHSWLFVYTNGKRGILMDPTWGAGTVEQDRFVPSENCWPWFNVAPEWMAMSHLPDDASYQLLSQPVEREEFLIMMPIDERWIEYGLDPATLFQMARSRSLSLPVFFDVPGQSPVKTVEVPLKRVLDIGETYRFSFKVEPGQQLTILNGAVSFSDWERDSAGVCSASFMPCEEGSLTITLRGEAGGYMNTVMRYTIAPPTPESWAKVAERYPLKAPEMKNLKNYYADKWQRAGIDAQQMLAMVRQQGIDELPVMTDSHGQLLAIVDVPMHRRLKANQAYTFAFHPTTGVDWAVVNGETWHRDWQVADDGQRSMTVTPTTPGPLFLYVQLQEGQNFWSYLEYVVE